MFEFLKKRKPGEAEPIVREGDGRQAVAAPRPPLSAPSQESAPAPEPVAASPAPDDAPITRPDARLADLLSGVFARRDEEEAHEKLVQQLAFFRKSLQHMIAFLHDTSDLGHTPGARDVLEGVLDSVTDLHDRLVATYALPPFNVAPPTPEMPFEEAGLGGEVEDEATPETETRHETLHLELEGLRDEVDVIREALVGDTALKGILADAKNGLREVALGELLDLCARLNELVESCIDVLARIPPAEERGVVQDQGGGQEASPVPFEAAPAPMAWPDLRMEAPAPRAASLPEGPRAAPVALSAAPVSNAGPPADPIPEATGLALVRSAEGEDGLPEAEEPPEPDNAHRTEEEAVHVLQDFFNEHSPEGPLLRGDEPEFARMLRQLLGIVCPGVELAETKLAMRTKALKDTFALRKKLHNRLTLREFKAFFGVTS